MKRRLLSFVLVCMLAASFAVASADEFDITGQNAYNSKESIGETEVKIDVDAYWLWTIPDEVHVKLTYGLNTALLGDSDNGYTAEKDESGVEYFGEVSISNVLYKNTEQKNLSIALYYKDHTALTGETSTISVDDWDLYMKRYRYKDSAIQDAYDYYTLSANDCVLMVLTDGAKVYQLKYFRDMSKSTVEYAIGNKTEVTPAEVDIPEVGKYTTTQVKEKLYYTVTGLPTAAELHTGTVTFYCTSSPVDQSPV